VSLVSLFLGYDLYELLHIIVEAFLELFDDLTVAVLPECVLEDLTLLLNSLLPSLHCPLVYRSLLILFIHIISH
jgi:hypothetical protein